MRVQKFHFFFDFPKQHLIALLHCIKVILIARHCASLHRGLITATGSLARCLFLSLKLQVVLGFTSELLVRFLIPLQMVQAIARRQSFVTMGCKLLNF